MAESFWRDQLQAASFRGVPFSVTTTEGEIGRRNVVNQYPFRDLPYTPDLGRKARTFSVQAIVIGDDYMAKRDKLYDALEAPGSGELVHPWRGRQQVVVTSVQLSESSAEGGLARFSISFTESGEALTPKATKDTGAAVNAAADKAQTSSQSYFARLFAVVGAGTDALKTVNSALNNIRAAADGVLNGVLSSEFSFQLNGIMNSVTSLMMFPANLGFGIMGMIQGLAGITNGPMDAFSSLSSLFSFGNSSSTATASPWSTATPSGQQNAINQAAIISLVQQAAVIEAARATASITPASYNDAITLRDSIADQLETLAETANDDDVYVAFTNLRMAVIQDINARAADLSRIVQYRVPTTLPALVIAYRLYQDASMADGIVDRNHIPHPGFVPGGQSIEVLVV